MQSKRRSLLAAVIVIALCLAILSSVMLSLSLSAFDPLPPGAPGSRTVPVTIRGIKTVQGVNAPGVNFGFTLTQVANDDGAAYTDGEPITRTASHTGAGSFSFPAIELGAGTYYFKVRETTGGGAGWANDASQQIVKVVVSETPLTAVVTYPNGAVVGGVRGENSDTVPVPDAPAYTFDKNETYTGATQVPDTFYFDITDSKGVKIEAACADINAGSPAATSTFAPGSSEPRDGKESALAFALLNTEFSGLDYAEFEKFFALTAVDDLGYPRSTNRRVNDMQLLLWSYEVTYKFNTTLNNPIDLLYPPDKAYDVWQSDTPGVNFNIGWRLSGTTNDTPRSEWGDWNEFLHLVTLFRGMMTQYSAGKNTSLTLTYTPTDDTTGTLSFDHTGYVPHGTEYQGEKDQEVYDAYLSWPETPGVTVTVNGGTPYTSSGASGISVKKSDAIVVNNSTGQDVIFTLIDKQHYLVADSIEGTLLSNGNSSEQRLLIGHADFVTLQSEIRLFGALTFTNSYTAPYVPTPTPSDTPEPTESPDVTPSEPPAEPSPSPSSSPSPSPSGEPSPSPSEEPTPPGVIIVPGYPDVPPPPAVPGDTLVPGDDGSWIEIGEDGDPLGEWHYYEDDEVWVFEPHTPLTPPPTGDIAQLAPLILLPLSAAVVALAVKKKRT
ncbi:MAG: hypothetical protein LBS90_09240 [Oscillospiraceae bacterium]|jgi:hypothetical protein|nr:hypothetical protein [Oscillospiraceae bacterium]